MAFFATNRVSLAPNPVIPAQSLPPRRRGAGIHKRKNITAEQTA